MGGWDLMLFFRRCKRCPFGIYEFYRLHLTSGANFTHHADRIDYTPFSYPTEKCREKMAKPWYYQHLSISLKLFVSKNLSIIFEKKILFLLFWTAITIKFFCPFTVDNLNPFFSISNLEFRIFLLFFLN